MPAGRPHSSTTPAWRSKPAIRVCLYHYLCYLFRKPPTKYGCAKEMGISRTTAIKWFETMRWNKEQHERYWAIRSWAISHMHLECRYDAEACAKELGYDIDEVRMAFEIQKRESKYVIF